MAQQYDLIIIGAGAAGMTAALYAGRAKLKTVVLERDREGGQIKITQEVENYPGIFETSGAALATTMRRQAERFGVEFVNATVERVAFEEEYKVVSTDKGEYGAPAVVVATGAVPRTIGFEGENEFRGRGVGYCATCDGEFFTGKEVFVVGGGLAAAEESLFLTRYASKVTMLVRKDKLSVPATVAEKVERDPKVQIRFNTELKRVGGDQVLRFAEILDTRTGETERFDVDSPNDTFGVFVFAGYEPQTAEFKGVLELDQHGYIVTDEGMRTGSAGVFAAGDVRPKELRQLVTAVADGALAATNAEKYIEATGRRLGLATPDVTRAEGCAIEGQAQEATPVSSLVPKADAVFFDADLAAQLAPILGLLEKPIGITAVLDDATPLGAEIRTFLEEFSPLTSKVSIEYVKAGADVQREQELGVTLVPSIVLTSADGQPLGVQFHGVPAGHELNSFVLALYNAAGPGQNVSEAQATRVAALDKPINVKIGVSLSCTLCPDVVALTQLIALKNPHLTAEALDVAHFPAFKDRWNIMSVPALVINDEKLVFGKRSLDELLDLLAE